MHVYALVCVCVHMSTYVTGQSGASGGVLGPTGDTQAEREEE